MELTNLEPRDYQKTIFKTTKEKNTLVVLPTGTGKTVIALLLTMHRLKEYPKSKVILCSPTKPLCNQHLKTFQKYTQTNKIISLLTGQIHQNKRPDIYNKSSIIIATPQTIKSDLESNRFNFKNVSLLILDEAHRSRQKYANTILAKKYITTSKFPRILALTASPGSTKEKINEIKENLFIDAIEVRTESDKDVKKYIQKKEIEWIKLELPAEYKIILKLINQVYKEKLKSLSNYGIIKPIKLITKKDLLLFQKQFQNKIKEKNKLAFSGISLIAQLLKLNYATELLETQGVNSFKRFIEKLGKESSKASKIILKNPKIIEIKNLINDIDEPHPKLEKLIEIIKKELNTYPKARIIVFANYRNTITEIVNKLKELGIKAERFVGQANKSEKGLKQKEQIELLNKFKEGNFNILVASQVAEEGIDIIETTAVIFFEPIASELRKVQRAGRTARTKPGKIIFLITRGTRDEAYYWASHRKEKRMKYLLNYMKHKNINEF